MTPPGEPSLAADHDLAATLASRLLAPATGTASYAILGRSTDRQLVLPTSRRAATGALLGYRRLRSPKASVGRLAAATAVSLGLESVITRPFPIRSSESGGAGVLPQLAEELGTASLTASMGFGNPDGWWKPVLQLFTEDGRPVGYAKVARNELTTSMLEQEWAALSLAAARSSAALGVPAPLLRTTWQGHLIVVVAPLPSDVRRLDPDSVPSANQPDVVELAGPTTMRRIDASGWWSTITDDLRATGDATLDVGTSLDEIGSAIGSIEVRCGWAHGDWVPWNMARTGDGRLHVWDWENGWPDAPVGIDDVHSAFQVAHVLRGRPLREALDSAIAQPRIDASTDAVLGVAHAFHVAHRSACALRYAVGSADAARGQLTDALGVAVGRARSLVR